MNTILGILFLLATILIGMVNNGKIKLDNIWVILIFIVQITSWIGYTNLLDIEKRYKLWLSVLSMCAVFIIGFLFDELQIILRHLNQMEFDMLDIF